jgi:hypothetical protein
MHQILERVRLSQIFQAAPVLAPVGFLQQGAHAGQIQLARGLRRGLVLVVVVLPGFPVQRIVEVHSSLCQRWQVLQLVSVRAS